MHCLRLILPVLLVLAVPSKLWAAGNGISREEYLRVTPPPPQELKVTILSKGILLEWQAPVPVLPAAGVGYDRDVVGYTVCRREGDRLFRKIGFTRENRYVDTRVHRGKTYTYLVVAVQGSGQESAPSQETTVRFPPP